MTASDGWSREEARGIAIAWALENDVDSMVVDFDGDTMTINARKRVLAPAKIVTINVIVDGNDL